MLGTGVGSELRQPLGITMVGGLIVSQVLTLFTTPVIYLAFDRLARRARRPAAPALRLGQATGKLAMNFSAPFIRRPVATTLLTLGVALAGVVAFQPAAGVAAAAGRLPDHLGAGAAARRQPGNHGGDRGHAAGARARPHRRRHRDDLVEFARLDAHHAAVRPQSRHRRRRARRAGGDQRRAQPAADRPAEQSDLPQGQSGRCADHDPGADLGNHDAAARCTTPPPRSSRRSSRRCRASARSPSAAARCRRCASSSIPSALNKYGIGLEEVRARSPRPTPTGPRARSRTATATGRSTPTIRRAAADYLPLIVAYRNGAAVRLSDVAEVGRFGAGPAQRGLANGKPRCWSS